MLLTALVDREQAGRERELVALERQRQGLDRAERQTSG
jgi:hypothetical protein